MMPLAPHLSLPAIGHMTATTATTVSDNMTANSVSKPKLAFSIDSIVGRNTSDNSRMNETYSAPTAVSAHYKTSRHSPHSCVRRSPSPPMITRMNQMSPQMGRQLSPMSTPSPILVPNGSTSSPYLDQSRQHMHPIHPQQQQSHSSHHSPIAQPSPLSHPMMMAAAHHMSPMPQHYHQAVALYPWLLRANPFANRFHGMPFDGSLTSFLLPPFRKPKRIRTAFSPGQLLKLEQAFEKNHYVVGNERKQLASHLGLSETQVKVWFQNRRTKHKRQKQEEEEEGTGSNAGTGSSAKSGDKKDDNNCAKDCVDSEDEDDIEEDIDMEDNEDSDSGNELLMNTDLRHHLWYQSMQSASDIQQSSSIPRSHSSMASTSSSSLKI